MRTGHSALQDRDDLGECGVVDVVASSATGAVFAFTLAVVASALGWSEVELPLDGLPPALPELSALEAEVEGVTAVPPVDPHRPAG